MTHIMLDLETWGKVPGSDIRSIGACVFDPIAGTVGVKCQSCEKVYPEPCTDCLNTGRDVRGEFYVATENPLHGRMGGYWDGMNEYRKYPLTRDPETIQWWNDQMPEAQAAFANPVDLREACNLFGHWIAGMFQDGVFDEKRDGPNLRIWANDPHFDVSILDAVFRAVGLPVPWHYRSPRSVKTIVEAAGMTSADYSNYGTAHNALDDAIAQAMTVCEAYKRLGLQK